MKKKGQAAMEFLMTYGWAILAAIIVIGVLAIYFRPSSIAPSSGMISAPFYANAWSLTPNLISMEIQNNAGEDVNVTEINATVRNPSGVTCTVNDNAGAGWEVENGALQSLTVSCTTLDVGDSVNADVVVRYTKGAGTLELQATGSVSGQVA